MSWGDYGGWDIGLSDTHGGYDPAGPPGFGDRPGGGHEGGGEVWNAGDAGGGPAVRSPGPSTTRRTVSEERGGGGEGGGGFDEVLRELIGEMLSMTRERRGYVLPAERTLFEQGLEALRTGGVGARLPIIQQSVEQSKQAMSRALAETESSLTSSGLTRTPYGQRIMGGLRLAGEQQTRQIPVNVAKEAIALMAQLVPGATANLSESLRSAGGMAAAGYQQDIAQQIAELSARNAFDIANLSAENQWRIAQLDAETRTRLQKSSDKSAAMRAVGTAAGAVIGSAVAPGVGTVVGGALGGVLGGK